MADQMMTPEEIETLRAYGTALLGDARQDPQLGANPYARVSALSPFVRALQAAQGRSTLNLVERTRGGQRQELFAPSAPSTAPPTTGAITPPAPVPGGGVQTPPTEIGGEIPWGQPRAPRPIRLNNPGAIEFGGFARRFGARSGDGRFARFDTPEAGWRAMEALLTTYMERGLTTPQQIIGRYAPAPENNVGAYATAVAATLGIQPDTQLTASDVPRLAEAMARVESGLPVTRGAVAPTPETAPMMLGMGGQNADPRGTQLPTGPQLPTGQEIDPETMQGVTPRPVQTTPLITLGATPPTTPPTTPPPSGQGIQPPPQLADLIAQSIPSNTSRIQQLQRMLQRAPMMSQEDAMKLRQEYDQLLGPQEKEIANFGKATFVYDAEQGRYVLDTFQPSPSVRELTAGGATVPNLYYYSRQRGGWSIVPQSGPGTAPGAAPPTTAPGTTQPGTIPQALLDDINRRLTSGDVVGAMAKLDEYKRQTTSLGAQSATHSGIRDDIIKEAREAPAARANMDSLITLLRRSNTWAGRSAQDFLELRRIMTNLGWLPAEAGGRAGLSNEELVNVLQTRLGSMASRSLTSRPTQFDFSQMLQVSPGLGNSPLGAQVIADYMRQEIEHRVNLGRIVARIPVDQLGTINDVIDRYYRENPITITIPAHRVGGPQSRLMPEMRVSTVAIPRVGERNPDGGTYTARDLQQFVLDNIPDGVNFWDVTTRRLRTSDHAALRRLLAQPTGQ